MTFSGYNIDALRRKDGTYGFARERFIRGALDVDHTCHLQTERGVVAIRNYTIDEVRTYPEHSSKAGEQVFPGEKAGWNTLVEFYPTGGDREDEISLRTSSKDEAAKFIYKHLNGKTHSRTAGQATQVWSNQAYRDATVLAVIDDEVLVEYEMPGTTGQYGYNRRTGQYLSPARPTSALCLYRASMTSLSHIRTYPHRKLPKKWIAAMREQGTDEWIGMGQREVEPVPFPSI